MLRVPVSLALVSTLGLGACAVPPPAGPSVMALPAQGKSLEAFEQDEGACRGFATVQTGGASPSQAATDSTVSSAVLGTALGAGVGAALGSVGGAVGAGAAIGGATGLLAGTVIGANNAQASAGNLQQRYDIAYTQCMYSRGNSVQSAPSGYAAYPGPYPYPYAAAYPYPYTYYPYAYGPSIAIGVGGGWGWGWHRRHW